MEQFQELIPDSLSFNVGYFEGPSQSFKNLADVNGHDVCQVS